MPGNRRSRNQNRFQPYHQTDPPHAQVVNQYWQEYGASVRARVARTMEQSGFVWNGHCYELPGVTFVTTHRSHYSGQAIHIENDIVHFHPESQDDEERYGGTPSVPLFRLEIVSERIHHELILNTLLRNGIRAAQRNPDGRERPHELYWSHKPYQGHISFDAEDDVRRSEEILNALRFDDGTWVISIPRVGRGFRSVRAAARRLAAAIDIRDSSEAQRPVEHPSHRQALVHGPSQSSVAGPSRVKLGQNQLALDVAGPSRIKEEQGGGPATTNDGGPSQIKVEQEAGVVGTQMPGEQAGQGIVYGEDIKVKVEPYP